LADIDGDAAVSSVAKLVEKLTPDQKDQLLALLGKQ
jgi:hypothetical protein